jgi:hypothetical protein
MQVWMKEIDLWLRNFLQITRSRFLSPEWSIFFPYPVSTYSKQKMRLLIHRYWYVLVHWPGV